MLNFIMSLYTTPTAKVRVRNGTRQGCPLSPILFILTLEPLLRCLRSNKNIKGIPIAGHTYKLAAFADDILLFLSDPVTKIPNLLRDFDLFRRISNLKINFSKSHALNISLPKDLVTQCQSNFPFVWKQDAITYLGIQLTTHLPDLYTRNFLPLIHTISDVHKWDKPHISWFGRAAILKMNILPRILYLLQTIPIKLPSAFFQTVKRLSLKFFMETQTPKDKFRPILETQN